MTALDHVALEVADLDAFVETVTSTGLLRVLRRGTHGPTGRRLVMLVDTAGAKLEVVEGETTRLLHLAFEVDAVAAAHDDLVDTGASSLRPPYRIEAAKATSAIVAAAGVELQVVTYEADSPDRTR